MTTSVDQVTRRAWPDEARLRVALKPFGVRPERIVSAISTCVHTREVHHQGGFQQFFASTLARHLDAALAVTGGLSRADDRYSPGLNEKADLALAHAHSKTRIFFEVEFRPNVEKDLVKFQIGANRGTLAVAVLILAIDRANINPRYSTMPEYRKFERIIEELRPAYPLMLIGIRVADRAT